MKNTVVKKTEKKQIKHSLNKKIDLLLSQDNIVKEMTGNIDKMMIKKVYKTGAFRKKEFTYREDSWLNDALMDKVKTVCLSDLKGIDNTENGCCLLLQKKHMNGCRIGNKFERFSHKKKKKVWDTLGCDGVKTCLSAFRVLENHIKDDELMFKVVKNSKHYFGKMKKTDYLTIIKKISKEKICFYECVPYTRPFRVAFDIDGNVEMLSKLKKTYWKKKQEVEGGGDPDAIEWLKKQEKYWGDDLILRVAMDAIGKVFNTKKRAISSAVGLKNIEGTNKYEMAYSYHIVLPTIGFYQEEEIFKKVMKSLKTELNGLDVSLYSKNHALRSIGQAKEGEKGDKRRVLKVHKFSSTQDWSDHLVQGDFKIDAGSKKYMEKYEKIVEDNIERINEIKEKLGCYVVNSARFDYLKRLKDINGDFVDCPLFDLRRDNPNKWLMNLPNLSNKDYRYTVGHFKMLMKTYKMWGGRREYLPPASYEGWKKFEEKYDGNEKSYFTETDWNNCDKENRELKWGLRGLRELIEQFYGKINDPIENMIAETIWNKDGDIIIKPKWKINPFTGKEEMVKNSDKFTANHIRHFETMCELRHLFKKANEGWIKLWKTGWNMNQAIDYKLIDEEIPKWAIFAVLNMGAGKTYAVLDWLENKIKQNPELTVCWLVHRRSMADNLYMRNDIMPDEEFESRCLKLGFKNYKTVKSKEDGNYFGSKPAEIQNQKVSPRMIMSVFSLKCVGHIIKYDIIIADEIESIYSAYKNERPCHGKNGEYFDANFRIFERLLTQAQGVVVMDAFMNKRTPKYLKALEPKREQLLITRCKELDDIKKTVYICQQFPTWFEKIVEVLKSGKKAFVFYPFKTDKNLFEMSMEGFVNILCGMTGLDPNINARYYHADVNQKAKRKDLEKATEVWGSPEVRLVMTNSCITVGVNCDKAYDVCFASWAVFLNPRDVAQSLMRIRKWNTDKIYYLKFDSPQERIARGKGEDYYLPAFVRPKLEGKPTKTWGMFRQMLEDEHYSFSNTMMGKYFIKCGFTIIGNWLALEESAKQLWVDASGNYLTNQYGYTTIEDIDEETYNKIQIKCCNEQATAKETLSCKKYGMDKLVRKQAFDYKEKVIECKMLNWKNDTVAQNLSRIMKRDEFGENTLERKHRALRFVFTQKDWKSYIPIIIRPKININHIQFLGCYIKPSKIKDIIDNMYICSVVKIPTIAHRWVEEGNLVKLVKDITGESQIEIVEKDFHNQPRWIFNRKKISKEDRKEIARDVGMELPFRRDKELKTMSGNILKRQIAEANIGTTVFNMCGKSVKNNENFEDILLLCQRYMVNFKGIGEVWGFETYFKEIFAEMINNLWGDVENKKGEIVPYDCYVEGYGRDFQRDIGDKIAKNYANDNIIQKHFQMKMVGICYIDEHFSYERAREVVKIPINRRRRWKYGEVKFSGIDEKKQGIWEELEWNEENAGRRLFGLVKRKDILTINRPPLLGRGWGDEKSLPKPVKIELEELKPE